MRIIIVILTLLSMIVTPVSALDITAPQVPEAGEIYMPKDIESFGDGFWYVVKTAISKLQPSITEACEACVSVIAIVLLFSVINSFSGQAKQFVELAGVIAIAIVLIRPTNALVHIGITTIDTLSGYSKLFLPVLTSAVAAQGGVTTATALYTGTSIFCSILTILVSNVLVPMIYIYMAICVACSALGNQFLSSMQKFMKWLITWSLKTVIYVFTAYISITGVISGTADATAVKATKIALSGVVPIVGNIIADTSETLLVSAATVKNTVGIYGLLAVLAVAIGPFLQTTVHSLLLKATAAICGLFGSKTTVSIITDFSGIMGLLLAMTGTICLLLIISTVCFMKGVPL